MSRSLPPLNALRAFEAAGRHLSFTKAAAELNVTPAAVSHQVKALEELLGVTLFRRLPRALRLTEAGLAALPALGEGFDRLAIAVDRMRAHSESGVLTISVSPSFGGIWLVPRLERFRCRYPEFEIRLDGTDTLVDLNRDDVDVAVRYGRGGYEGVRVDRLFGHLNTPVCSPVLMTGPHPLRRPEDLRHHTLLHIDSVEADATWRMWLRAAGLKDVDPARGPRFTMESMVVQSAIDGHGVALLGDLLVADQVAAGRLVRPFDPRLSTPLSFAFYVLTALDRIDVPKIAAFREWILEEARDAEESL